MTPGMAKNRSSETFDESEILGRSLARQFWSLFRSIRDPVRTHPRWTVGLPIATAATALALSFAMKVEYTSSVCFFVDRSSRNVALPSGLAAIGRQLGLGDLDAGQPMDFYAWLASSDGILSTVLLDTGPSLSVATSSRGGRTVVEQLFDAPLAANDAALAKAVKKLRKSIRTRVDPQTSLISIQVSGPSRELATYVAQQVFREVNRANTVTRQTRASNEVRFLRAQQQTAADSLRAAERTLSTFYERNRQYQNSPNLVFEQERLRRAADLAREVYLGLTRSAQEAELRAVGDVPALTLIEGPTYPLKPSKPNRILIAVVGAILGIAVGYAYASHRMLTSQHRSFG